MRQSKRFSKALQGLSAMIVWVHEVAEEARRDGLSRQHLQDAAVVRLLDSGLKALGIGNVPEPPGNPWLNIFVNAVKIDHSYFCSVTVRLDEVVWLERNRAFKTIATTWEVSAADVVPADRLAAQCERTLDDLIDYFIYDYQMANFRR